MKELLIQVPRYFKVNLHTHTNISDGNHSPEEVKEFYKSRGYSAVAFTDHEVCIAHPELCDEDFLALTAYELATTDIHDLSVPKPYRKTFHLNFLSKTPDNRWQVYEHMRAWGNALKHEDQLVTDGFEHREYSVEDMNAIIARANEHGFLVTYNHPVWSRQDYTDYSRLKGLWATEVFNTECYRQGYNDDQDWVLQDLLTLGNTVFPVAADDFHDLANELHIGQGWVMVGAKELTYEAMIEALEKGDFYASTGPDFLSVSYDGECYITVKSSPVRSIDMVANCRYSKRVAGENITEGRFGLGWLRPLTEEAGDENAWVRFVLTDENGKKAYTRPFYLKDL